MRYFIVDFDRVQENQDALKTFNNLCCEGGVLTIRDSMAKFKEIWKEGFRYGIWDEHIRKPDGVIDWEEFKKTL